MFYFLSKKKRKEKTQQTMYNYFIKNRQKSAKKILFIFWLYKQNKNAEF